jgi:adenylate cyclase
MPEAPQPREIKVNYKKSTSFWMTAGIVIVLFMANFLGVNFLQNFESKTIDLRFTLRGQRPPQAPIRIVAIDEKSLKEVGQWPWPRAIHANLVKQLKLDGVKAVFYDVFFPEPERSQEKMLNQLETVLKTTVQGSSKSASKTREKLVEEVKRFQETQNGDKEFGEALKEVHNVFLPIIPFPKGYIGKEGGTPDPESLHFTEAQLFGGFSTDFIQDESVIVSIPDLQKNVLDSGSIRYINDPDGIYRYFPVVTSYQGHLIPQMSLQVARCFLDDKDPIKVFVTNHAEVAGRKIPILDNGMAFINYCGPEGIFTTISASDVLNDRVKHDLLKGSVVLVGATAEGLHDLRPTPFTHTSPGVEMNANIIENVYSNSFLALAPEYLKFLLMVFLALMMWYLVPRVTPTQGTVFFFLMLAGYLILAFIAFSQFRLVINVVYPTLALLLTFVMLTTYKFRTEVKHSRYMKQMFQSMVAPSVVEEILKLPAGIELGGEEKNLTVMFSDVRGFTTYSEKHTPKEVVEVLNEYLTQMTHLVFQTEGTLDKYIGDAIMAFWGAPTVQQDNAYRACSTALGMVDLLHNVLHRKWELEGKEKLEIGVGLNTGPMVVGFVGSETMKSYTLIGDAVNLGSRLEGTTKEYHVEIIISETTFAEVKNDMLCRELDLIKVKGKNEPIRIYELVDHRLKGAGAKEMKVKAFEEGLALYRAQKWDEAVKSFKKCLELEPKDGPADIFIKRCNQLQQDPPGANWDGVFVMKTK